MNERKPLFILGTRTFAVSLVDMISVIPEYELVGFVENMIREKCSETLEGLPILWVEELAQIRTPHWAICGLSTTHRQRYIDQVSVYGIHFATLIHPQTIISKRTSIGEGTIVNAGVNLGAYTAIGNHVLVNRSANVGHHTQIGDYATIGFASNIAGDCRIGTRAYVAMGANVLPHLTIGAHSIVGAGSVVTKDVPDHTQVVGIPAKVVKQDVSGL